MNSTNGREGDLPLVFVSHAAADNEVASGFKNQITSDFLGMCEVFVSSNLDSISAGQEWHNVIKAKLLEADIIVALLSPLAITRGWVYAEVGAGWIRGIPTIPLCHSGLRPADLPAPLNSFQGLQLSDPVHLQHLYRLVGDSIGCNAPQINFEARADEYHRTTTVLRQERDAVGWLMQLSAWNPEMLPKLARGEADNDVLVPSHADPSMFAFATEARALGLCEVTGAGFAFGTRLGASASIYEVAAGPNFSKYVNLGGAEVEQASN